MPEGLDATLVLLRHGESQWIVEGRFQGQSETPLSPDGRRQAELAGARLARPHASPPLPVPTSRPLEIVHSPLARTAETAAAVAAAMSGGAGAGVVIRADDGFKEIAQGEWEGVTHDEINRRWRSELAAWRRSPVDHWAPGGESIVEVQARMRPALARMLARLGHGHQRGTLDRPQVAGYAGAGPGPGNPWSIAVGHDGLFKVLLLTLFDIPLTHFWMFTMALGGITVVEFRGGRPVLRAHNLSEHMAPLLDERALEAADRRASSGAL